MSRRAPPQRALFANLPQTPRDATPVTAPMILIAETDKAWELRPRRGAQAKWVPKSEVTRGEGAEAHLFTFPKWLLQDRGWL